MAELLLVVRLAGRTVAFPAADVEGVVELEGLTPAPGAAPHVAGLSALRSRVLTVIDGLVALEAGKAAETALFNAVVVPSGGHPYAILVDAVVDVVEPSSPAVPLAAPAGPGWDRVALGMVDAGGDPLLLIDPHALIAGAAAQAAA
jgi:purine-binding chemotaxis protein CheW